MCAKITFFKTETRPEIIINKPTAVKIESSWKMLTDKASIVLPRNVKFFDKHKVKEVFKKGDAVKIELGYNGNLVTEFEGYITKVSANIPIVIECEDEMYQLKKIPVNISLKSTSLKSLFNKILPGYTVDALEVEIGSQRFVKSTVAKVLKKLQEKENLYSYFKENKTLVVGKVYADDSDVKPIKIHLEKNVVNNDLNYKSKEDVLIKIKAISTLKNGNKIEVEVGDQEGESRQLTYYNIKLKADLIKLAEADYKKYKVDGFDGTIKLFGIPIIRHGYKVELKSDLYKDRNGTYYVERTTVVFDETPAFRRTIELGDKVK